MTIETKPLTIPEVLRAAADLCGKGWTQGRRAVDKSGYPVYVMSPKACKFCMVGGIYRAVGDESHEDFVNDCRRIIRRHLGKSSDSGLASWNDARIRTQAEVVAALRGAADLAEREAE